MHRLVRARVQLRSSGWSRGCGHLHRLEAVDRATFGCKEELWAWLVAMLDCNVYLCMGLELWLGSKLEVKKRARFTGWVTGWGWVWDSG